MRLAKLLALVSLGITAAAVLLFLLFPPSSPELSFVLAAGISFILLLLFSLSVMEAPGEGEAEGAEAPRKEEAPEEKREEVISKLREALEEGVEPGGGEKAEEPEREEKEETRPEPLSGLALSPPGWKLVGEGEAEEEAILGRGDTKAKGPFRIWEKEGRRLALYTLLFPSPEAAGARLEETMNKLGGLLQRRLTQQGHFHLEREGIDGMIWRRGEVMFLLLLGKGEKGEIQRFLEFLPEDLRPPEP
jgi:hypothetical protein